MPLDLRIPPGRDHRPSRPALQGDTHASRVVGPIRRRTAHRIPHLLQQGRDDLAIVLDVFRARGVGRVIKSKSMLQEECGMTPFLGENGRSSSRT